MNQLVPVGDHAVVRANPMRHRKLVVVVVEALPPIGWSLPNQQRFETAALHLRWGCDARDIEKRLRKIDQRHDPSVGRARRLHPGAAYHQRTPQRLFKNPALVEPAMLAQKKALVGRQHHERVFRQPLAVEKVEHPADVLIDRFHASEVVMQIAVVPPPHEVAPRRLRRFVRRIPRLVVRVPFRQLLGSHVRGGRQFGVEVGERAVESHVMVAHRPAASLERIKQRGRFGVLAIFVPAQMPKCRGPLAVRGLVLTHQEKRLRAIATLQPVERQIGDDVRHIARGLDPLAIPNHRRVVVQPLSRQDLPVIKPGRIADEVPFPNQRCRVPRRLQQFGERHLATVERRVRVVVEPVPVGILAGKNRRPARPADRVRHQAPVKPHPFPSHPVDVRRLQQLPLIAITTDRLTGEVIGKQEQNVGPGLVGERGLPTPSSHERQNQQTFNDDSRERAHSRPQPE